MAMYSKEQKALYDKEYNLKNREKRAFYRLTHKKQIKEYKSTHKEQEKQYWRKYYLSHWEERSIGHKEYNLKNRERIAIYMKDYNKNDKKTRRKNNIQYRISELLRNRLNGALRNNYKIGSAVRDLGCTILELKLYLEERFHDGMTWDNWTTDGWHIDHKKPLSFFDLTNRKQFLEAVHYTNIQPMWADENLKKGGINNKLTREIYAN